MSNSSHLEAFLRNLINNVPYEEYDEDLLYDIDRRFLTIEDQGIELEEEFGFDLEGRLLLVFYRLACFEGFKDIDLPEKLMVYKSIKKLPIGAKPKIKIADKQQAVLNDEAQKSIDRAKKLYAPEYTFGDNQSLDSIKELVGEYRDIWLDVYLENDDKKEKFEEELRGRILSIKIPVYSDIFEVDDLITFSVEMFDFAIELSVSAYVAYKLNDQSVAWTALSKANECLGLCLGSIVQAHKNKSYIARKKGPYVKKIENDFIKNYLISKVHQKTERAQNNIYSNNRSEEQILSPLMDELYAIAEVMHDKLHKAISLRALPTGGEVTAEEVLRNKIDNWVDGDPDFKLAIEEYIKAERSTPFDEQLNADWVCIKKIDLENIYKNLHLSSLTNQYTSCVALECPVNKENLERTRKARSLLRDPLFETLQRLRSIKDQDSK